MNAQNIAPAFQKYRYVQKQTRSIILPLLFHSHLKRFYTLRKTLVGKLQEKNCTGTEHVTKPFFFQVQYFPFPLRVFWAAMLII